MSDGEDGVSDLLVVSATDSSYKRNNAEGDIEWNTRGGIQDHFAFTK